MSMRFVSICLLLWNTSLAGAVAFSFGPTPPAGIQLSKEKVRLNDLLAKACYLDTPNQKKERIKEVRRLLESGADPNVSTQTGFTPLMHAARWGNRDTVVLLLSHGAKVNLQDKQGISALMYACSSGFEDKKLVVLLLRSGAKISQKDNRGRSSIAFARLARNRRIERVLIGWTQQSAGSRS